LRLWLHCFSASHLIFSWQNSTLRLKQINLAGFKSFVDPTHIPVPGQLVGIVGPNGCGKSNIIDAVRWVLGETSAKHLRGATMQDVLFNGSGDRKPVNRASVELVFDNQQGKAGGQWSTYAEISVKRVLERDGNSSYYINNLHVRRRDVADIFLGTGLGSRAYAIIEQGMISRVIEAKPEDLRVFLEEAAGVSKYRERRRETELRLRDTRENLARVDDIRQELDKQLTHLEGQAEVAQRYHALQGEVGVKQHMLWYVRQQEAIATRARHARDVERLSNELEAETAKLRDAERRLEELREQHYRAGDEVHGAQGALYETNAEISRIEQQISHIRDNRARIEQQMAGLQAQQTATGSRLQEAEGSLQEWRGELSRAEVQVADGDRRLEEERQKLPLAESAWQSASSRREELQKQGAAAEQARGVAQTRRDNATRVLDNLSQRSQRLHDEQSHLERPDIGLLQDMEQKMAKLRSDRDLQREQIAAQEAELPGMERELSEKRERHDAAAQAAQVTEARLSALAQLQEKLKQQAVMEDWLEARGLNTATRLWQSITIESGYEDALEAVLGERLNALCLEGFSAGTGWLSEAPPGRFAVADLTVSDSVASAPVLAGGVPLSRYVTCRDSRVAAVLGDWLHEVFVVASVEVGLQMRGRLSSGSVLVTRDGYLFTRGSVFFHSPDSELHGVLSRQREIEALQSDIETAKRALPELEAAVAGQSRAIEEARVSLNELRAVGGRQQQALHGLEVEHVRLTAQMQRLTQRGEQIASELTEIEAQAAVETAHRNEAITLLGQLEQDVVGVAEQLRGAQTEFEEARSALDRQRELLQQADKARQEAEFQRKTALNKIAEIERLIASHREALARLVEAMEKESAALSQLNEAPWQGQLQALLELRKDREQALAQARDGLEAAESQLRSVEQERIAAEQKLGPLRERINEVRLKEHEAKINEEQYAQQLAEAGADVGHLAETAEKGVRSGALQLEINRLNDEIKSLGAVNLAALEELESGRERKAYLDSQSADLTSAMNTLEDAIRKIDRESRERLQSTFDEVNSHFMRMFPALFGGGNAKLLLTGEEILDSGIQVIAQPPGKKNSSIHLLSGGEKALTAMSLVFAIFQLNPAPFCMLDEVDAPLDDHNTGRFCDLVKEMSKQSQFVFISHNKITMEIANQLMGITMQEPGVSRVVAVDIDEAMKLTEEAA
jgi:chromosome segregation protein